MNKPIVPLMISPLHVSRGPHPGRVEVGFAVDVCDSSEGEHARAMIHAYLNSPAGEVALASIVAAALSGDPA